MPRTRGPVRATPPGSVLFRRKLSAGPFAFRVYAREGTGDVATNPRLDAIVLCDNPHYRPPH